MLPDGVDTRQGWGEGEWVQTCSPPQVQVGRVGETRRKRRVRVVDVARGHEAAEYKS